MDGPYSESLYLLYKELTDLNTKIEKIKDDSEEKALKFKIKELLASKVLIEQYKK